MAKNNPLISGGYWSGGSIYPNISAEAPGSENTKPEPQEQSKMTTEDMPTINKQANKTSFLMWIAVAVGLVILLSWAEK